MWELSLLYGHVFPLPCFKRSMHVWTPAALLSVVLCLSSYMPPMSLVVNNVPRQQDDSHYVESFRSAVGLLCCLGFN